MENDSKIHIVEYDIWCPKCKHYAVTEKEAAEKEKKSVACGWHEPCLICLDRPANYGTNKPVKWEEKDNS